MRVGGWTHNSGKDPQRFQVDSAEDFGGEHAPYPALQSHAQNRIGIRAFETPEIGVPLAGPVAASGGVIVIMKLKNPRTRAAGQTTAPPLVPQASPPPERGPAKSPTKIQPVGEPIPELPGSLREREEAFKKRRGGLPPQTLRK